MVITGLTRNQVASRGLEGSNPSVSAKYRTVFFRLSFFICFSHIFDKNERTSPPKGHELPAIMVGKSTLERFL